MTNARTQRITISIPLPLYDALISYQAMRMAKRLSDTSLSAVVCRLVRGELVAQCKPYDGKDPDATAILDLIMPKSMFADADNAPPNFDTLRESD